MYGQGMYGTDMNMIYKSHPQDNYDTYNDTKSRKKFKKSDLLEDTNKLIEPKSLKKQQQQQLRKTSQSLNQTNSFTTYDYSDQAGGNSIILNEPISFNNSISLNEKTRLLSINEAFEILRLHIPTFPYERRLSKIDTLHLAISYINLLESVLESNMTLYDYLRLTINQSFGTNNQKNNNYNSQRQISKPIWATSGMHFLSLFV